MERTFTPSASCIVHPLGTTYSIMSKVVFCENNVVEQTNTSEQKNIFMQTFK
jgi:hypothetical protein